MRFLDESQHWELEKLEAYQLSKLKVLLESASSNVPFYNDLYKKENIDIDRIKDFRNLNKLPVLSRDMTMAADESLLSEKINLKQCKIGRTGGTTGPPLRIIRDTETRSWSLAAYYRFYNWMGVEPGMPEVELWGSSEIRNQKSDVRNQMLNKINKFRSYNTFSFNDAYLKKLVSDLQKHKPKLIRGYLSAIILLADYIKRNNIKGLKPVAISSTSETLFPQYRKMIEEIFEAPLFNQYGCGECNSIAFECKEHNGLHIASEHCILENDENNNLIVTNLDNTSQPFIRYRNGDVGLITNKACACGNSSPRLISLEGRKNENIILKDGASVNGIFFANLLDEAGFVNTSKMLRFQVVQDKKGEIEFRVEVNKEMYSKDVGMLKDALTPFFDKVMVSQHQFLDPGPGGKFRYIISQN